MRYLSAIVLALLLVTTCSVSACRRAVAGVAHVDPNGPATAISKDGFGIVARDAAAPVQIELYTEPQCTHCADLQKDFSKQMSRYMDLGQLAITYRPLTFLDTPGTRGHSGHVANALFLAAGPATSAKAFQTFVEHLWRNQDPGGTGPTNNAMADLARASGIPAEAAAAIRSGKHAVDLKGMADNNFGYLYEVDPVSTGTPTVYDLKKGDEVNVYDNNWLATLMSF